MDLLRTLKTDIHDYCTQKSWYFYLPVFVFYVYLFSEILKYKPMQTQTLMVALFSSLNFLAHEFAHLAAAFLPTILMALAGSFVEIAIPLVLIVVAFRQRGYFTSILFFIWLTFSCLSAGQYMADARSREIELSSLGATLSGSSSVIHDWHYIFNQLSILNYDVLIGEIVILTGILIGVLGLLFGMYLIYTMATASNNVDSVRS